MSQGKNSSFEGHIQYHYMEEEEVEGEQRSVFFVESMPQQIQKQHAW